MRYPAAETLDIIRRVEQSRLPVRRTLDKLGLLPARFYRGYDRDQRGGYEALKDRPPRPKQVCNRIPDDVRGRVLRLALQAPELSPRERAMRCIDTEGYFVSEASVYRLLKAHDLITRPACVVLKAADAFKDKTVRPNQWWQTDFTDLKVIGWGGFYLSTLRDDFSRSICGDLVEWLDDQSMEHVRGAPYHPQTQGKIERWHQTLKNRTWLENYYLPGDLEAQLAVFRAEAAKRNNDFLDVGNQFRSFRIVPGQEHVGFPAAVSGFVVHTLDRDVAPLCPDSQVPFHLSLVLSMPVHHACHSHVVRHCSAGAAPPPPQPVCLPNPCHPLTLWRTIQCPRFPPPW